MKSESLIAERPHDGAALDPIERDLASLSQEILER